MAKLAQCFSDVVWAKMHQRATLGFGKDVHDAAVQRRLRRVDVLEWRGVVVARRALLNAWRGTP
jgi:hypothetical protein